MNTITLSLCMLITFCLNAQNDSNQNYKKHIFGINLNYLKANIGEVEGGDNLLGMVYSKKQSLELEIYIRYILIKNVYVRPGISFVQNNYANTYDYNRCSYDNFSKCLKLSVLVENKIINSKYFFNIGKLFQVNKNIFYIELGVGRNSILKRNEHIEYKIFENNFNQDKVGDIIDESRNYLPEQLTKLRFRFTTGVSFKLLKKIKLNYQFFVENLNYDRYKFSSYKPDNNRFYHNFNIGFGLGFSI